jgi:hypothetical protein
MNRKSLISLLAGLPLALACSKETPLQPNMDASKANNSEQVVFSGDADLSSTFAQGSEVGFWIWCEADGNNSYLHECNGAMQFDDLRLTRHVEGDITELSEGIYQMTVSSTLDNTIVNCVLTNAAEAVSGPKNRVDISCTTPSGSVHTLTAVVNVTGPPEP